MINKLELYILKIPKARRIIEKETNNKIAKKMKNKGAEIDFIIETTGLSKEEIEASGSLPSISGEPVIVTKVYDVSSSSMVDGLDMNSTYLAKGGLTKGVTIGVSENNSKFFLAQLKAEYDAMVASVKKYGGFHVGRYEVSNSGGKAQSVKGVTSAKAGDSTSEIWYGLYALCKTYKTSSVTSCMIWGSQWEAMMNFIGDDKTRTDGRNF